MTQRTFDCKMSTDFTLQKSLISHLLLKMDLSLMQIFTFDDLSHQFSGFCTWILLWFVGGENPPSEKAHYVLLVRTLTAPTALAAVAMAFICSAASLLSLWKKQKCANLRSRISTAAAAEGWRHLCYGWVSHARPRSPLDTTVRGNSTSPWNRGFRFPRKVLGEVTLEFLPYFRYGSYPLVVVQLHRRGPHNNNSNHSIDLGVRILHPAVSKNVGSTLKPIRLWCESIIINFIHFYSILSNFTTAGALSTVQSIATWY